MNPVGLTRAEQEKEQPNSPPAPQPPAPAGAPKCIATLQPDGRVCGAEALWLVVWSDPEAAKSPACTDCAKRFRAQAESYGRSVGIEPIGGTDKR